ncbi:MAG TPA: glycogen debranching N-terminal domain-containing protein [Chloroflexia bacterium]|nr:glycogen debranching N-terminal domain-containing protein [Chloroflexia bacterium]
MTDTTKPEGSEGRTKLQKRASAHAQSVSLSVVSAFNEQVREQRANLSYKSEADISNSMVIKCGNLFMLLNQNGDASVIHNEAEGVYFHDCRYLSKFTLQLGNLTMMPLLSSDEQDEVAEFELVNSAATLQEAPGVSPSLKGTEPERTENLQAGTGLLKIPAQSVGISRHIKLGQNLIQTMSVKNYNRQELPVDLKLEFDSDFLDIFTIRGTSGGQRGSFQAPRVEKGALVFAYLGADDHLRLTRIKFDPPPDTIREDLGQVVYHLNLAPHATWKGNVTISFEDRPNASQPRNHNHKRENVPPTGVVTAPVQDQLEQSPNPPVRPGAKVPGKQTDRGVQLLPSVYDDTEVDASFLPYTRPGLRTTALEIESANELFNRVLDRSFRDLQMLLTHQGKDVFFAAGIPWFVTLFGRDSLITAIQTVAYNHGIAAGTLELLASYQGTQVNPWRDEQPGKILHELRVGERANLGEVPFTPYYGTVDATPLFLILMGEYLRWSGDFDLFRKLLPNIQAALEWIENYGFHKELGFVAYASASDKGLANQGWKDSGNSIVNADGSLVEPPVALVEVQGYVYRAKMLLVPAFREIGDSTTAERLAAEAEELQKRFNRYYWMPDLNYYALALQRDSKPARVIASNPGQALWAGIVEPEYARHVSQSLIQPDMFNGWGIRTLSAKEAAYNPFDYQVGAVWPHDNSLIAAGLKRYGFVREAARVLTGVFNTACLLPDYRLPEVFSGVERRAEAYPVKYPVACRPQAWAAGAVPFMLTSLLGIIPDLPNATLRIVKPFMPEWLERLTIYNLAVGDKQLSLEFTREESETLVRLLNRRGNIKLSVEY